MPFQGIAMILLIITAGGVFKQVFIDSGTGNYIASFSSKWHMPPLNFWLGGYCIITGNNWLCNGCRYYSCRCCISISYYSQYVSPELLVLAVGTGSVFGSHINDSGFWMFKEFFKLSLKQTFLSWTVMETVISIIGLIGF